MSEKPKTLKDLPVTILSCPKVGSTGKTGFWRTFRPSVDQSKCTRCLFCWIFCPESCIERSADDLPVINYDFCKGCGICANECPVKAIKMEKQT